MKRNLLLTLALGGTLAAMAAAPYTPPYSYDFNSGLGEFTTDDANSDQKTFSYNTSYAGISVSNCVAYNGSGTTQAADDWLFSPQLSLEGGLVYEVSFYYKSSGTGKNNKIEVKAGATASVADMTMTVCETFETGYTGYNYVQKTMHLCPTSTGNYVVGIHVTSDADQGFLYLDNFGVAAGKNGALPDVPTAGTVSYNANGDKLNASFDITAPANNFAGNPLTGNLTLNILRADRETPETLTATPGQTVTFTDADALPTNTTYTVSCTSAGLEGESITVNANPVLGTPNMVEGFTVTQNGNVFNLNWDAVTTPTIEGEIFVPASVRYNVKCGNTTVVADFDGTNTTYTYPMPEEGQEVIKFSIEAKFGDKVSGTTSSALYVVGNPLTGAFAESFANYSYTNSGWSTDVTSYRGWITTNPGDFNAQDGDNGCIRYSEIPNAVQKLYSPKLDLSSLTNAKLKFWVYMQPTKDNLTSLQPGFVTNGVETLLGEPITPKDGETDGWKEYTFTVPESATAQPTQIVFEGKGNGGYNYIYMDNISIRSYLDHNLAISAEAPASSFKIGQEASFTANVSNMGSNAESDYTVALYAGEDLVTTIEGSEIPVDGTVSVTLPFKALPKYAGQEIDFRVEASLASDLDNSNNEVILTIPVLVNDFAVPSDLIATSTVENVQLSWTAPEVSTDPIFSEVTESFENWETGTTEPQAGWIFINDDVTMKGVNGVNSGEKFTAMVSEGFPAKYSSDPAFAPYDGEKALVISPANSYGTTLDKWIISPEVQGGTDITFYAQSYYYNTWYSNTIQILWSAGGTTAEDFTLIDSKSIKAYDWVECTAALPAEARRFAIRFNGTVSTDVIAFDKFTFTGYSNPPVLSGYNLYRDDAFVATLPADVTSYADAEAMPDVTHTYNVTALYDKAESLYSEAATGSRGTSVGIQGIDSDLEDAQYYTLDGLRIDNPAKGQIVIVRRGDKVSKMIVK